MDNTPGRFSTMLLSLSALPLSENDFLPRLAWDHDDFRSHSWIHHYFGKDLNISSKTSAKSLSNLAIEVLDASQFPSASCLFQKLVDLVLHEASHCLLENTPLSAIVFEVISSGETSKEVSVDPSLNAGQTVSPILVKTEELVLETCDVFLLDAYSCLGYSGSDP